MRSTGIAATLSCLLFLTGCAAKTQTTNDAPHSLELIFRNSEYCKAFLIRNDTVSYEFSKNGTYSIKPGKYLFVGACGKTYGTQIKSAYLPGKKTKISLEKGLEFEQQGESFY